MDYTNCIADYIEDEIALLRSIDINAINEAIKEIVDTYNRDGNIFIFGNGGSASTASHFMNDFNKGISEYTDRKFRFVCLNDNIPTLLAIANDIGYEEIFRFQLQGKVTENDLVIGISGSGNSINVLNAIEYAKNKSVRTLGITGYDGGKLIKMADVSLHVPVMNMQLTEDVHMMFDHLIMSVLYRSWGIKGH